ETLSYLTPSLSNFGRRELFGSSASPAFDLIGAAQTSVNLTFDVVLNPKRLARIDEFKRRDPSQLGLAELFEAIKKQVMTSPNYRTDNIAAMIRSRYAYALMDIIQSESGSSVRGEANLALGKLSESLGMRNTAQIQLLLQEIARFKSRTVNTVNVATPDKKIPPGSPIGMNGYQGGIYENCWHCEP
ncbi:MAG: hypothetical protein JKX72_11770, partial [Robiginitomaculum sp.]|nr:hypothetical protein [Robiginitomaculum sp.]